MAFLTRQKRNCGTRGDISKPFQRPMRSLKEKGVNMIFHVKEQMFFFSKCIGYLLRQGSRLNLSRIKHAALPVDDRAFCSQTVVFKFMFSSRRRRYKVVYLTLWLWLMRPLKEARSLLAEKRSATRHQRRLEPNKQPRPHPRYNRCCLNK